MNWSQITSIAATIVVSLGGGGAIVLGLSQWIGRILADRYVEKLKHEIQQEVESFKTKLRKSEFLFQKEFEAASEFMALRRRLMPKYRFQDMDWHDACEDFAHDFAKVEKELERYVAAHGAALNRGAIEGLTLAIDKASSGRFQVLQENVTREGIAMAEEVMNKLEETEKELREAVWSQSST